MAMDLLLNRSSVLEEKNQEPKKEIEESGKVERRLAVEGESFMHSSPNKKDSAIANLVAWSSEKAGNDGNMKTSTDSQKEIIPIDEVDQLESAKAEMGEVKEENERLKMILSRILKDYQALQTHLFEIVQQEGNNKSLGGTAATITAAAAATTGSDHEAEEQRELVFLSLGNGSTAVHKKEEKANSSKSNSKKGDDSLMGGLSLGLDCKFDESPENSYEDPKEEEVGEGWPPTKLLKTSRGAEDDVSQQAHIKKARVSVRARCDAPTMQDGCQWRKYGQKIAKGNPCPRAYYRCTLAPACPVRKQVQRCAEDMSILITTYEGAHNHPLPLQATAMASTTSAAASILMSGSSAPTGTDSSTAAGLTFDLSDNLRPRPFYLSNPAVSSSPSFPTITLDLTSTSSTPQLTRLSSTFSTTPRYSSSIGVSNFSFSNDQTSLTSWNSSNATNTSYFNYGSSHHYNKSPIMSSVLARPPHEQHFFQTSLQKPIISAAATATSAASSSQQNVSDTIAAATKVITSDPSFRSALAAAITSIVGGNGSGVMGQSGGNNVAQSLKWGEQLSSSMVNGSHSSGGGAAAAGGADCGPAFLNKASSGGASGSGQQGSSLAFLAAPLPFSPAADIKREHNN